MKKHIFIFGLCFIMLSCAVTGRVFKTENKVKPSDFNDTINNQEKIITHLKGHQAKT